MINGLKRHPLNPLLTPKDITPSHPDLSVMGVFNAGATQLANTFILLLRVAESRPAGDHICVPLMNRKNEMEFKRFYPETDHEFDYSDSRFVAYKKFHNNGRVAFLTSLSHFRVARSDDGIHFTVDQTPIMPEGPYEHFGIEDPRISLIDGVYHIVYTSVSEKGVTVSKMTTLDFVTFKRDGVIFPPENKDVALYPEKINGRYYAWHRPVPYGIGGLNMWLASSLNLLDWGHHQCILKADDIGFEKGRIGAGAPPLKCALGWLHIFHGADDKHRYALSAFVTDLDDPARITHVLHQPLLMPEAPYEVSGFFDHVVFSCGVILKDDLVYIYYGAADSTMALATVPLSEIEKGMIPYEIID